MDKHLHIVCLDIPYPADHGGLFDILYKIKTLYRSGIKIHLHCFEYGRQRQEELNNYCLEVNYYLRNQGHKGFSLTLPYIVCSRSSQKLRETLLLDNYPILLEGIHCSYLLTDCRFEKRKIILRLHNVESLYYRQLYHASSSLLNKIYFLYESIILKQYERRIANKAFIVAVSQQDVDIYRKKFGARNISYLPVFLPSTLVTAKTGTGCFCLYHGNLSVPENEKAVIWLLRKVFDNLALHFVIAGKNPSPRLERITHRHPNACLVSSPSEQEMQDMIGKAQVHILPSFNCTGIKLKLLNALFNGRHCVVNEQAVLDTGLGTLCHISSSAANCKKILLNIYQRPFTLEEIGRREDLLSTRFNNEKNAERLIQWIW